MAESAAILSLHSHGDRSFLDDRDLALLSGLLRERGHENDLVLCVLNPRAPESFEDALTRLSAKLGDYGAVVFERVWDRAIIERLRRELPDKRFIYCAGEHVLEDPPADFICGGDPMTSLPALFDYLSGTRPELPPDTSIFEGGSFRAALPSLEKRVSRGEPGTLPNLRPVVVNPEALPPGRTFSIVGNPGCPYQNDARDNPLYEGIAIPEAFGRGCAFCTTGNHYEHSTPATVVTRLLDQIRHVRDQAPELTRLVLKDQNPFGYLLELVERCTDEGLGGFTLLLETRADWFLRSRPRLERALEIAARSSIRVAPFLVGIESFSDEELRRFNKGSTAATNEAFLSMLDELDARHEALDTSHASFGFVLFTPWTTMDDLRVNYEAVVRTGLSRYRGELLLSRARLYPDTALYYLADRDGLLTDAHRSIEDDSSARYGYYPSRPWRFVHDDVARFAELAAVMTRERGSRDELALWKALLDAFDAADGGDVDVDAVERALAERAPAEAGGRRPDPALRKRLERLVRPLSLDAGFADGWSFGGLRVSPGALRVDLEHPEHGRASLDIVADDGEPAFARSRHYALRHVGGDLEPAHERALRAVCDAIVQNDR